MVKQELLHHEEVRGLFVLGVIATILAFKNELASIITPTGGLIGDAVVLVLAATWGSYAFLMAIGLSDDVFKPRVCSACLRLARLLLWLGVYYFSIVIIVGIASFLFGEAWFHNALCLTGLGCVSFSLVVSIPIIGTLFIVWSMTSGIFDPAWRKMRRK
jgi:hypothetical protein